MLNDDILRAVFSVKSEMGCHPNISKIGNFDGDKHYEQLDFRVPFFETIRYIKIVAGSMSMIATIHRWHICRMLH